jgi:hypothetical protein
MDEVETFFGPISKSLGPEGVRDGLLCLKMREKKNKSLQLSKHIEQTAVKNENKTNEKGCGI